MCGLIFCIIILLHKIKQFLVTRSTGEYSVAPSVKSYVCSKLYPLVGVFLLVCLPLSGSAMVLDRQTPQNENVAVTTELEASAVQSNYALMQPVLVSKLGEGELTVAHDDACLVAKFLLYLDRAGDRKHYLLDPVKLQKLLYYVQGYALAIYGKTLFAQQMVRHNHGALEWDVFQLFKGQSFIPDDQVAALGYDASQYNHAFKAHVGSVFEMKKMCETWKLVEQHHQEAPYLMAQQGQVINADSLRAFFSDPKQVLKYCVGRLITAADSSEIAELIRYMREYISYGQFDKKQLLEIERYLLRSKDQLERVYTRYEASATIAWRGQTPLQTLLGHFFFPVQCEYGAEPIALLQIREPMQLRIALSASHGHILAQSYCVEILSLYDANPPPFIEAVVRYFGETAASTHQLCLENPSEGSMPFYLCGLYCMSRNKLSGALAHFKKGFEMGDPWCRYRYILMMRNVEKKREAMARQPNIQERKALALEELLQARVLGDVSLRTAHYVKAGTQGMAEGYHSAAILARAQGDAVTARNYFLLAARNHLLSDFEEEASVLISQNCIDKAKVVYETMAKAGDEAGLMRLAALYKRNECIDEANKFYEKAGLRGLEQMVSNAVPSSEEFIRLSARCHSYKQDRFNELLILSKGDRIS